MKNWTSALCLMLAFCLCDLTKAIVGGVVAGVVIATEQTGKGVYKGSKAVGKGTYKAAKVVGKGVVTAVKCD